ncbi:UNVERIFIED_CONTAM: hypothetical protein HDU68_007118 [Siphonaria sp. JEL0065]|nr:hypothetical protein HDU68_007118 [Siphonaria sp. JEL0065]
MITSDNELACFGGRLSTLTFFLDPDPMKLFEQTQTISYPWDIVTTANWIKYPNEISTHVISLDILSREVDPVTGVLRTERLLCCKQSSPKFLRTIGIPIPEVAWFREVSYLDPKTRTYTATSVNLTMRNIMVVKETCVYKEMREMKEKLEEEVLAVKSKITEAAPSLMTSLKQRGLFSVFGGSSATAATTATSASSESLSSYTTSVGTPQTNSSSFTEFVQTAEFHAQIGVSSVKRLLEDAAASRFQANAAKGIQALESVIVKVLADMEVDG